jgi:hypothetical protein
MGRAFCASTLAGGRLLRKDLLDLEGVLHEAHGALGRKRAAAVAEEPLSVSLQVDCIRARPGIQEKTARLLVQEGAQMRRKRSRIAA